MASYFAQNITFSIGLHHTLTVLTVVSGVMPCHVSLIFLLNVKNTYSLTSLVRTFQQTTNTYYCCFKCFADKFSATPPSLSLPIPSRSLTLISLLIKCRYCCCYSYKVLRRANYPLPVVGWQMPAGTCMPIVWRSRSYGSWIDPKTH